MHQYEYKTNTEIRQLQKETKKYKKFLEQKLKEWQLNAKVYNHPSEIETLIIETDNGTILLYPKRKTRTYRMRPEKIYNKEKLIEDLYVLYDKGEYWIKLFPICTNFKQFAGYIRGEI